IAVGHKIFHPDLYRIKTETAGYHIDLRLPGPCGLRATKTAKRTTAHCIRIDQGRCNPEMRNFIGARSIVYGSIACGETLAVGAAIPEKFDLSGSDRSVAFHPGLHNDRRRDRACARGEFLVTSHYHLDRSPGLKRQSDGIVLQANTVFTAEAAPTLGADYPDRAFWNTKNLRQSGAYDEGFLRRRPNRDGIGFGFCDTG